MSNGHTMLGQQLTPFCRYHPPFLPPFGEESAFSLITVCLEFLILLFLLSCILRKKWYQCRGEENKARSLLLPYYDRVLYYYCGITIFRIIFYLIQFIWERSDETQNTKDAAFITPVWIVIPDSLGIVGIIGLEVFILFLLMQTSAGTKAYKRAWRATLAVCTIELILILSKHFFIKNRSNGANTEYILYCIGELLEETVLLSIVIGVFIYSYFYQIVKNRKRERNKILYRYIICLCVLFAIVIIAYILLIFSLVCIYCISLHFLLTLISIE